MSTTYLVSLMFVGITFKLKSELRSWSVRAALRHVFPEGYYNFPATKVDLFQVAVSFTLGFYSGVIGIFTLVLTGTE